MRAATFMIVSGAAAVDTNPVKKVMQLLTDLSAKVQAEGVTEAKTYNEVACGCHDNTKSLSNNMQEAQSLMEISDAKVKVDTADRTTTKDKIAETEALLQDNAARQKTTEETFKLAEAKHRREDADFSEAIRQLRGALVSLRSSRPSLAQLKSSVKLASALASRFSDLPADDPKRMNYEFHAEPIIEMLEKLEKEFVDKKHEDEEIFIDTRAEYDQTMTEIAETKRQLTQQLENLEAQFQKLSEEIAKSSKAMTDAQAGFQADSKALQDLTANCRTRKAEFDQRTDARKEEVQAITQAIAIIGGTVSDMDLKAVHDGDFDKKKENQYEGDVSGPGHAFIQTSQTLKTVRRASVFLGAKDPAERAAEVLSIAAKKIGSHELAAVASRVTVGSPFRQVTKMIQNLIERLEKEANTENDHKGWCTTQLAAAKQSRDNAAAAVARITASLLKNEAQRDADMALVDRRAEQMNEIKENVHEAEKVRREEKANNRDTINDSQTGLEAIEKALEVLRAYYDKAATNTVSFVDAEPAPAEAYQGAQDSATGIFGMIEVIVSDFKRSISETEALEKKQERDFKALVTDLMADYRAKKEESDRVKRTVTEVTADMNSEISELKAEQGTLNTAIEEWESLRAACVTTGESYEDRVAKRKQEIEALQEALKILSENATN